jgi:preprotein translocase subunit YajC
MFSLQNIPAAPAPGHQGVETTTATPSAPHDAGSAQSPGLFGYLPLILVVVMLPLLLFSSRSQAKKQAATIASLAKGDRVLLQGGMVGKLVEMGDRYAKVEIAAGVKVDYLKNSILGKDTPETAAQAEKK